jgi:hypothetical protein
VSGHRGRALLSGLGLAAVTFGLYLFGRSSLGDLPWTQPHRLVVWWHSHGTLLVTLGLVREMLFWIGCYLVAVWAVALLAGWRSTSRVLNVLGQARLPGARLALRAGLGLAAVGSAFTAGADPSYAVSDGGALAPAATTPTTGSSTAPVLRYVGPGPSSATGEEDRAHPPQPDSTRSATSPTTAAGASQPPGLTAPRAPVSSPAPSLWPPEAVNAAPRLSAPGPGGPNPPGLASPPPGPSTATSPLTPPPVAPIPATPSSKSTPAAPAPAFSPARPGPLLTAPASPARRATTSTPSPAGPQPGSVRRAVTWVVRPGDSLWSIAEATLAEAWGHRPALRDLAPYWWQVVQVNRPNLPEPADPNLLLPGDQVTLPSLPPPPAD